MKVTLISPWDNAWVPHYKSAVEKRGHDFIHWVPKKDSPAPQDQDVVIHGWATGAGFWDEKARHIVCLRRYELFDGLMGFVPWERVRGLVCVNKWIKEQAEGMLKEHGQSVPTHLIYNSVDLGKWTFRERGPGTKIGMACHIHPKKNLPLALQVIAMLPPEYSLHIAGGVQDECTMHYIENFAQANRRSVVIYGQLPSEQMNLWWEQMNYCLSTSLSEGNPNNVIEAMAKGIKPLVHRWPGVEDQFDRMSIFDTADWAAKMILSKSYDSASYRRAVEEKFSLANVDRVLDLALEDRLAA